MNAQPDFVVADHFALVILFAQTDAARAWVDENLPDDALSWGIDGTVIEHRYLGPILDGIHADGLTVR